MILSTERDTVDRFLGYLGAMLFNDSQRFGLSTERDTIDRLQGYLGAMLFNDC